MASMNNCEAIASRIASEMSTTIDTKSAGDDTGIAWCSGTLKNKRNFAVLHIDDGNRYNIEINNLNSDASNTSAAIYVTVNRSATVGTIAAATKAVSAWNAA